MAKQLKAAFTLKVMRRKQVQEAVGLSKSTLYAMIRAGDFPAPIRLGARAVGWLESEVEEWITRQALASLRRAA